MYWSQYINTHLSIRQTFPEASSGQLSPLLGHSSSIAVNPPLKGVVDPCKKIPLKVPSLPSTEIWAMLPIPKGTVDTIAAPGAAN